MWNACIWNFQIMTEFNVVQSFAIFAKSQKNSHFIQLLSRAILKLSRVLGNYTITLAIPTFIFLWFIVEILCEKNHRKSILMSAKSLMKGHIRLDKISFIQRKRRRRLVMAVVMMTMMKTRMCIPTKGILVMIIMWVEIYCKNMEDSKAEKEGGGKWWWLQWWWLYMIMW